MQLRWSRGLPGLPPAADGQVGTRNYLGILTSVNCSGSVARFIAEAVERQDCSTPSRMSMAWCPSCTGRAAACRARTRVMTRCSARWRAMRAIPNFAGILLVGLGCEVLQVPDLVGKERLRKDGQLPLHDDPAVGRHAGHDRARRGDAGRDGGGGEQGRARPAGVEHLVVGMQCGGSDGYSGITANPALGHASDPCGGPWRHDDPVGDAPRSTAPSIC